MLGGRLIGVLGMTTFAVFVASADAQVDVSNSSVTCDTIVKGSVRGSPPLVLGGTRPALYKVKGKLAGCTADAPVFSPDFKSSFSGVLTSTNNDCLSILGTTPATGTITVRWRANEAITPTQSTVTINAGSMSGASFAAPWGATFGQAQQS